MYRRAPLHHRRDVLAERGTHLEPVSGTAADEPHVLEPRVPVDEEVAVVDASYWHTRASTRGALAMAGNRSRSAARAPASPEALGLRSIVVGFTSSPAVSSATLRPRRS